MVHRFVKPNGNITGELNLGKVFSGPILNAVPFPTHPRGVFGVHYVEKSPKRYFPLFKAGALPYDDEYSRLVFKDKFRYFF